MVKSIVKYVYDYLQRREQDKSNHEAESVLSDIKTFFESYQKAFHLGIQLEYEIYEFHQILERDKISECKKIIYKDIDNLLKDLICSVEDISLLYFDKELFENTAFVCLAYAFYYGQKFIWSTGGNSDEINEKLKSIDFSIEHIRTVQGWHFRGITPCDLQGLRSNFHKKLQEIIEKFKIVLTTEEICELKKYCGNSSKNQEPKMPELELLEFRKLIREEMGLVINKHIEELKEEFKTFTQSEIKKLFEESKKSSSFFDEETVSSLKNVLNRLGKG